MTALLFIGIVVLLLWRSIASAIASVLFRNI